MKKRALATRLSLLLSATVIVIFALSGFALYQSLAKQIGLRDDAALLTRIDQIRTLLRDEDAITLIQQNRACSRICWATLNPCWSCVFQANLR
ncbi:hypothetical protein [Pantoea rodasii]|uniref:hypothetical protein n=1 Tax=Pantoea rodasii TaxID=1076549 RepID=UPI00345298DA